MAGRDSRIVQRLTALSFNTSANNRPNFSVLDSSTSDIQEVDSMTRSHTATRASRILILALASMTAAALGCGSDSTEPQIHAVATIDVSAKPELEIGQPDTATAI